jgi:hypothetical protein
MREPNSRKLLECPTLRHKTHVAMKESTARDVSHGNGCRAARLAADAGGGVGFEFSCVE